MTKTKTTPIRSSLFRALLLASIAAVSGCASLESIVEPVPPTVSIESVRLDELSLEHARLVAEVRVDNPNPISVALAGFDYQIEIEGARFVSGRQETGVEIAAQGTRTFDVPVMLEFAELRDAIDAVGDANQAMYTLSGAVDVDIPILGRRRIEVAQDGTVPIPRLPGVRVAALTVQSIGLAGAELALDLTVDNPNVFGVRVDELQYRFSVNGRTWIEGAQREAIALSPAGADTVTVPFTLRFVEVGRGIYRILTGEDQLEYRFIADSVVRPDHPLLAAIDLPVDRGGVVELRR